MCGGPHYARECPRAGGGQIRTLASLTAVTPVIHENRYQVLGQDEDPEPFTEPNTNTDHENQKIPEMPKDGKVKDGKMEKSISKQKQSKGAGKEKKESKEKKKIDIGGEAKKKISINGEAKDEPYTATNAVTENEGRNKIPISFV